MDAAAVVQLVIETLVASRAPAAQFGAGVSAAVRTVLQLQLQRPRHVIPPFVPPVVQGASEGKRRRRRLARQRRRLRYRQHTLASSSPSSSPSFGASLPTADVTMGGGQCNTNNKRDREPSVDSALDLKGALPFGGALPTEGTVAGGPGASSTTLALASPCPPSPSLVTSSSSTLSSAEKCNILDVEAARLALIQFGPLSAQARDPEVLCALVLHCAAARGWTLKGATLAEGFVD